MTGVKEVGDSCFPSRKGGREEGNQAGGDMTTIAPVWRLFMVAWQGGGGREGQNIAALHRRDNAVLVSDQSDGVLLTLHWWMLTCM